VSSDQEWLEWLATFKAVRDLAKKRMYSSAMTMIEKYLSRNPPSDLRRRDDRGSAGQPGLPSARA
jgi:hypothetical protein